MSDRTMRSAASASGWFRALDGRAPRRIWATSVIFVSLSGTAWVLAFGEVAAGAVVAATAVVSTIAWIRIRPAMNWRRLPWVPLVYVAWAALSLVWSAWPGTTVVTWLMLAVTAFQGLFVAAVLTWRELIDAVAAALKIVLGLSIVFELVVSLVVQHPLLPRFGVAYTPLDPFQYWSHNNLLMPDIGYLRIQGIVGNANLLAAVCVVALIVLSVRLADRPRRRVADILWIALTVYLLVRAGSATAYVSLAVVAVVLGAALLMRTTSRPRERNRIYLLFIGLGAVAAIAFVMMPNAFFRLVGREADFTGREDIIWTNVIERAIHQPVFGWGFASPWLPWDPMFSHWIVDHDVPVMQAHNMWLDVFLQLGIIGVVLVAVIYLSFLWRAWFFAVDRPRFDLRADRPFAAISLIPTLVAAVLLVQGMTESGPLMLWGWMFVVMFTFKIKQAPVIGHGPAEGERLVGAAADDGHERARAVGF